MKTEQELNENPHEVLNEKIVEDMKADDGFWDGVKTVSREIEKATKQ